MTFSIGAKESNHKTDSQTCVLTFVSPSGCSGAQKSISKRMDEHDYLRPSNCDLVCGFFERIIRGEDLNHQKNINPIGDHPLQKRHQYVKRDRGCSLVFQPTLGRCFFDG